MLVKFLKGCSKQKRPLLFGESKLFELQCAELFELTYIKLKMFGFHVFFERSFVLPSFANHKYVGTCGTFECVVSNVTFVLKRCCSKGNGGLKGFFILTLVYLLAELI